MKKLVLILTLFIQSGVIGQTSFVYEDKVMASDAGSNDYFSSKVGVDGDYAIVGAQQEDEDVNGLNTQISAGSAYIYERNTSGDWLEVQKIVASDRAYNDRFGCSVTISGNYAAVGARQQDPLIGGNIVSVAGAVYIFQRNGGGVWNEIQKVVAPDGTSGDTFGSSVNMVGDYLVIGATEDDDDQNNANPVSTAGSVYIYKKDGGGVWNFVQKIVASDRDVNDQFGFSVSISGDYIVVSTPYEDHDLSGSNMLSSSGSAYIFKKNLSGVWVQTQKIVASDRSALGEFGYSASMHGDYLIVGARSEAKDELGNNTLTAAGAAYVFEKDGGGVWNQAAKVVAPDREAIANFGHSAALNGNLVVIGAYREDKDENGLAPITDAGAAYIFERNIAGNWLFSQKIDAPDRAATDEFGFDVDITSNYILVGALREDNNSWAPITDAGSAYFYKTCFATLSNIQVETCDNYMVPSGDETYSISGTYTDTIPNANGCDSIITIDLTILNNAGFETIAACDSYTWPANGVTFNSTGTYMTTLTNVFGCDSVAVLSLTIHNSDSGVETITACDSYTWPTNGVTYSTSGSYVTTLSNVFGCDSVVTLNLTIHNSNSGAENITACDSYTWPNNGVTYSTSGSYITTLSNVFGCDSVVTLNLTIHNSNSGVENITACDSYTWPANGVTFNSSGTYMTTLTNVYGCDSVATLNLTIHNSSSGSETITTCNNYTWPTNGVTYTSSGSYQTTVPNSVGCDSVVTLNLTIHNSNSGSETVSACNSYTWSTNGITYTNSGTYTATLSNVFGCDSTVTLNLTINNSSTTTETISACESYTWTANGVTYTASGMHMITLTNSFGCDSVVTLDLTINNGSTSTEIVSACNNYTWLANGTTYTSTGTYQVMLSDMNGCDSLQILDLTINSVDVSITQNQTELISNATSANYQWISCPDLVEITNETNQSYNPSSNGAYAVIVEQNGCIDTSDCVTVNTIGLTDNSTSMEVRIFPNPGNGSYNLDLGVLQNNVTIVITDLQGRILTAESYQNVDLIQFNINESKGVYLLRIITNEGNLVLKVIKE